MRNILHLIQSYSNIRWGFETEGEKKKIRIDLIPAAEYEASHIEIE